MSRRSSSGSSLAATLISWTMILWALAALVACGAVTMTGRLADGTALTYIAIAWLGGHLILWAIEVVVDHD